MAKRREGLPVVMLELSPHVESVQSRRFLGLMMGVPPASEEHHGASDKDNDKDDQAFLPPETGQPHLLV